MEEPFEHLDPRDQEALLEELRDIMREPDEKVAAERRRRLATKYRESHPDIAAWLSDSPLPGETRETPLLERLPVIPERANALKGEVVLVKYGGNAMVDDAQKQRVIADVCALKNLGALPVVVHGGGPAISELLGDVGVKSRFVGGHRKTDRTTMSYVEMALSGKVNSEIVKLIGFNGYKAAGFSGKDGNLVTAMKRIHRVREGKKLRRTDLGLVGDVKSVNPDLVHVLLKADYIPVIAPVGLGEDLEDYNINADMFAGHMAVALNAVAYVVLTDVDGIFVDTENPDTLITEFSDHAAREELGRIVQGGMIPKVESCLVALKGGVREAHIVNGTSAHSMLLILLTQQGKGTTIHSTHA